MFSTAGSRKSSIHNGSKYENSQSLSVLQEKDDLVRIVESLEMHVRDLKDVIGPLTQERDNANGQSCHLHLTLDQVVQEKEALDLKFNELNARFEAEKALRIAAEDRIQQLKAELRSAVPASITGQESGADLVTGNTSLRMYYPEGMDNFNRKKVKLSNEFAITSTLVSRDIAVENSGREREVSGATTNSSMTSPSSPTYTTHNPISLSDPYLFMKEMQRREIRGMVEPSRILNPFEGDACMDVDHKPMIEPSSAYSNYVVLRSVTSGVAPTPRPAYGSFNGIRRVKPPKMNKDEFIDAREDGSWVPPDNYNGDKVCMNFVRRRTVCTYGDVCRRFHPREEDKPKLQKLRYY